jgi:hypothetical protein
MSLSLQKIPDSLVTDTHLSIMSRRQWQVSGGPHNSDAGFLVCSILSAWLGLNYNTRTGQIPWEELG